MGTPFAGDKELEIPERNMPAVFRGAKSPSSDVRASGDDSPVRVDDVRAFRPVPEDHPARVSFDRGNAFVARDQLLDDALVQRLYRSADFQAFVAACVGLPQVHELADPLSGLCVNVVGPGRSHPWHFDTNDVTVSILTRAPDAGDVFEYCPGIRTPTDERFADVGAVLAGTGEHLVRRLELRTGDLQLFAGRYALHRVTPVAGDGDRHSAIFAYSERPGVVGSVTRTRQLFGRITPMHEAGAAREARVDGLLD